MEPQGVWIVGMGEVGRRLAGALRRAGWSPRPVTRDAGWAAALDESDPAPRVVAVREEQLGEALARFPDALRPHLVLVQNGFLEAVHGDLGPPTRGLIYFTAKGDFFRVLAASPFHGPHAGPLAGALCRGGIEAEALDGRSDFLRAMIVKGIWNSVVGLPLAVHGVDLASYRERHHGELEDLVAESALAAGSEYGVRVEAPAALATILGTAADLGHARGGTKALAWRNGALAWFGRRHGVPTPINDRLLRAAGYDPEADPRERA